MVDQVQGLRQDDAIETVIRKVGRVTQIAGPGGLRMISIDMQHLALTDTLPAKSQGVLVIADLQHDPLDVQGLQLKEVLDVIPIQRTTPVVPELRADRPEATGRRGLPK